MKTLGIAALALLMTATGALAAEPEGDDQSAKQEKKICRSEKITGSLTRVRRTCMTEREWARLSEITQRNVQRLSEDGHQATLQGRLGSQAGAGGGSNGW